MNLASLQLRSKCLRVACSVVAMTLLASTASSQTAPAQGDAAMPSPPATATVTVAGGTIDIHYNTPHLRGRHVGGPEIVPYDKVWRTGANPATTLITSVPLKFGDLLVPAGTHTIYTLPTATDWKLIVNNETGQWGTEYKPEMDLGRVAMKAKSMSSPQEVMSLTFENTSADSTELHVRWDTTDRYVVITKP
ncbi:MAG TPA: DUF2911 domain-containing protein [Acidobacteriaceae bacterium]